MATSSVQTISCTLVSESLAPRFIVPNFSLHCPLVPNSNTLVSDFYGKPLVFSQRRNGEFIRKKNLTVRSSLFGRLFGKGSAATDETLLVEHYHDVPLPFPRSLLANTVLETHQVRCCYKASIDGFSATDFHRFCDFKGPCIFVCTSTSGMKFGGFNPEGYRSTDDYFDDFDAFLFYWPDEYDPSIKPVVLPKVGGSAAAVFDYARGGPQFGPDGLLVGPPLAPVMGGFSGPDTNSGVGTLREAKSRLGLSFARRPDGKKSLFGDEKSVKVEEVEAFCSPRIAALY